MLSLSLHDLVLRLPALGGMPVAEAVHVGGFDANAGTVVVYVGGAEGIASHLLTAAPVVDGIVLLAHGGFSVEVSTYRKWSRWSGDMDAV